jgi:flagellar assembly protein FliH
MPSSDADDSSRFNTIFLGPSREREKTLDSLRNRHENEIWSHRAEIEYMERVKARAAAKAEQVLDGLKQREKDLRAETLVWLAQQKGLLAAEQAEIEKQLAEAKDIREHSQSVLTDAEAVYASAEQRGFAKGMEMAEIEAAIRHAEAAQTYGRILTAIQAQARIIFDSWREDLISLIRQAVETGSSWILDAERANILAEMFAVAVRNLEDRRRLVISAHPDDTSLLEDLLKLAKERFDIGQWEIAAEPALAVGSLILESPSGRVDSSRILYRSVVEEALSRLVIPRTGADEQSLAGVREAYVPPPDAQMDMQMVEQPALEPHT